jgi:hypothetical protein
MDQGALREINTNVEGYKYELTIGVSPDKEKFTGIECRHRDIPAIEMTGKKYIYILKSYEVVLPGHRDTQGPRGTS